MLMIFYLLILLNLVHPQLTEGNNNTQHKLKPQHLRSLSYKGIVQERRDTQSSLQKQFTPKMIGFAPSQLQIGSEVILPHL